MILHSDYPESLASNTVSQRIKMNENFKDGINSGHFKEFYFMQAAIISKDSNVLPFNYLRSGSMQMLKNSFSKPISSMQSQTTLPQRNKCTSYFVTVIPQFLSSLT